MNARINKNLVLAAMVFAVAMTFIDQTIVAIAIPSLRRELGLTATGAQWIINGYLLALSALFAFGGKLGDVLGRRRMVVIGVIGFALTSALCGATPTGSAAQAWIITFRVLQGASTALIAGAMGLVVLGFQQSAVWGWGSAATWACIVVGLILGVAFVARELRTPAPLLRLQIFRDRGFSAETAVLLMMNIVFIPFFFFASVYAQVSLGKSSSNAGVYILYFFIGFVIAAQIGGRILDNRGARPAVVLGAAVGAVGFYLLAGKLTDLSFSAQQWYIALAGAGPGLMLGAASTDPGNRA